MSIEAGRRVGVVTGGGRGIGRGIVHELARRGYALVVNYRDRIEAAERTCGEALALGASEAIAMRADVADLDDGRSLVDRARERFGRLDVWVNNAGIAPEVRADLLAASPASFDRVVATNLRGPYFLTQAVAARMVEQVALRPAERRPLIVFITSISSTFASPSRGEYCISKAGLSMAARLFAVRLAEHGIGVFEVRPGVIDTEMTGPVHEEYDRRLADGLAPIGRWGTPEDVGRVVGLLADGRVGYSTGEVFHVDGGLHLRRL